MGPAPGDSPEDGGIALIATAAPIRLHRRVSHYLFMHAEEEKQIWVSEDEAQAKTEDSKWTKIGLTDAGGSFHLLSGKMYQGAK
ncbi:hypothetical protein WISP_127098 [Willisornis vidua]|uniref:Uncharacterized protein n=1 Tax=Willisornis vidua TaxID=1566151 RepID=A0ABQ9CQM6_9PASS|nr:hypothetical protein WISP_127098 [Willisornis vidua]